jgi:hypothetical protein
MMNRTRAAKDNNNAIRAKNGVCSRQATQVRQQMRPFGAAAAI